MTKKPDLHPRIRCKALKNDGSQCNRSKFAPTNNYCCSHIAKDYRRSLRLGLQVFVLLCFIPFVTSMPLIITQQLNHTVNIRQGDTKATQVTFQVNNTENRTVDAIVFFITRDPTIVTVDEVAEDARTVELGFGTHNISAGLFGLKLATTYIDYGVITDVREPFITDRHPYGRLALQTKSVNMSVFTEDSNAQCRYSDHPQRFQNMLDKFVDVGSNHTVLLIGLENNKSYTYYVRCWIPINSSQINQSSFLVNVTCPRAGWCGDGDPAVWTELALNYTNVNQRDFIINFSVGNVYSPAPVVLSSEPAKPIVVYIKPFNVTPYVPPKIANVSNLSSNNVSISHKSLLNVSKPLIPVNVLVAIYNETANVSVPIYNTFEKNVTVQNASVDQIAATNMRGGLAAGLFVLCLLSLTIFELVVYMFVKQEKI